MSNVAPHHHAGFNGSPGLWWKLERWIQDELVAKRDLDVWVIAGSIFGPGEIETIGPDDDISVPAMSYKIVILPRENEGDPAGVLAFLFPHQRIVHGDIEDFLSIYRYH